MIIIQQSKEIHWIVFALASVFVLGPAAADLSAQDLRGDLERVYRSWISANVAKNYKEWERHTAAHRVALTHNMVVSRKEKWPDVIFSLPFRAPDIATLRHLETLRDGPTAHMVYYGKIDFGILEEGQEVPNNMLALRFVEEESGWKFDNTRFFNLSTDPAAQELAKKGDRSFLSDDRFRPTGVRPEIPPRIKVPDYPGDIWIASVGYETTVSLGDMHRTMIGNNVITDMIMGGLVRAGLEVTIEVKELEVPEDVERKLEIEIYALRPEKPAARIWEWRPKTKEEALAGHESKVWANAVTIPGG